jgi:hypothetical protein
MVLDYFLKNQEGLHQMEWQRIAQEVLNLILMVAACCAEYPSRKDQRV